MKLKKRQHELVLVSVIALSTLLSYAFDAFNIRIENILLIHIVGMVVIMIETHNLLYGIFSTIASVFILNFLFINPKYTFVIDDPNYIIMLIIFFIVAIILNMLTSRLQTEVIKARKSEEKVKQLYVNSKSLLNLYSKDDIIESELKYLYEVIKHPLVFYIKQKKDEFYAFPKATFDPSSYLDEIQYAIDHDLICGQNENKYSDLSIVIFPFKKNHYINGAIIMDVSQDHLNKYEKDFIVTNMVLILMALEREWIERDKEQSKIDFEREKLKSTLLRSLSHDLRTPLTSLQTGSSFILDSYDQIDESTRKSIIEDIYLESTQLSDYVENLLNMTKITSGKLTLNRKSELIVDILNDVYQRMHRHLRQHKIEMDIDQKMAYIHADSLLLTQVLVNLIDNAIKHTKEDSTIHVTYRCEAKGVYFEVADDGGGISSSMMSKLFQDFASDHERTDHQRGSGLGLSIAKSIVEAHHGTIEGFNNENGGATFRFYIPQKE